MDYTTLGAEFNEKLFIVTCDCSFAGSISNEVESRYNKIVNRSKYSISMDLLDKICTARFSDIEEPKTYLGINIPEIYYSNTHQTWVIHLEKYVKGAILKFEKGLFQCDPKLNKRMFSSKYTPQMPFSSRNYRSELDASSLCNPGQIKYFQSLIGILRWLIELGRIDIAYEVTSLSKFLMRPRIGHITQAQHIFKYLEIHFKSELSFDLTHQSRLRHAGLESNSRWMK